VASCKEAARDVANKYSDSDFNFFYLKKIARRYFSPSNSLLVITSVL
jgi:hypothetical protein